MSKNKKSKEEEIKVVDEVTIEEVEELPNITKEDEEIKGKVEETIEINEPIVEEKTEKVSDKETKSVSISSLNQKNVTFTDGTSRRIKSRKEHKELLQKRK